MIFFIKDFIYILSFVQGILCTNDMKSFGNCHYQIGMASYYAEDFHGLTTASGSIFDMNDYTVAHKTLPFGTILEITNLWNKEKIIVKVTDRGPYAKGRILDVSKQVGKKLGIIKHGYTKVKLKILFRGKNARGANLRSFVC